MKRQSDSKCLSNLLVANLCNMSVVESGHTTLEKITRKIYTKSRKDQTPQTMKFHSGLKLVDSPVPL